MIASLLTGLMVAADVALSIVTVAAVVTARHISLTAPCAYNTGGYRRIWIPRRGGIPLVVVAGVAIAAFNCWLALGRWSW